MAAIVIFGSPPMPPAPLIATGTASCHQCRGQGRVWEPAGNGEGLVPRSCEICGGGGLTLKEPSG
jgi:hypothetical protein